MTHPIDRRSEYDKAIGADDRHDRARAVRSQLALAIGAQNWPAVQAWAALLAAEETAAREPVRVRLDDWEDLANAITSGLSDDLRAIANR